MPTVKPAPQYDVFISYRRGTADELALLLQEKLQKHGVTAFLDRDLRRGTFDDTLLRRITESPTFLIILTPGALDRCSDQDDWLRREIVQAINSQRNIIPLQVDSFQFSQEVVRKLDPSIRPLSRYQTVEYYRAYLESAVERIARIVDEDKAERRAAQEAEERKIEDAERDQRLRAESVQRTEPHAKEIDLRNAHKQADVALELSPAAAKKTKSQEQTKRQSEPGRHKWLWLAGVLVFVAIISVVIWKLMSAGKVQSGPGVGGLSLPDVQSDTTVVPGTLKTNPKDGLGYVWIPQGSLQMGCSAGDSECYDDEKPIHSVTISKGFWMGQTLVTQAAYQRVTNSNPSQFHGEKLPVESVTWNQAKAYCEAVEGRLPTEAEWEYAARAGTTTPRYGNLDAIAWYDKNSGGKTHDVALKQANSWGLYDMLGNVWEWVGDWYDAKYYKNPQSTDPVGPTSGQYRVVRGGSWFNVSRNLRSSYRNWLQPGGRSNYVGFRCVREMFP